VRANRGKRGGFSGMEDKAARIEISAKRWESLPGARSNPECAHHCAVTHDGLAANADVLSGPDVFRPDVFRLNLLQSG